MTEEEVLKMQGSIGGRPSDNYKTAITDPVEFFGRKAWLQTVMRDPLRIHLLLGGRRLGKTSALRAVEWSFLDQDSPVHDRPFPVFINLQREQPKDPSNLRHILIDRLGDAIHRWQKSPWAANLRDTYRRFLQQVSEAEATVGFLKVKITNPAGERGLDNRDFIKAFLDKIQELRKKNFFGVCFLLDETEFIVRQDWANDACGYFRALREDTVLRSYFGLFLSGYRGVWNYKQKIGSPLYNITDPHWLSPLVDLEINHLNGHRARAEGIRLTDTEMQLVTDWAGGHPFLTQQMLNAMFDNHKLRTSVSQEELLLTLLQKHHHDFSSWWNADGKSDGFSDTERAVYSALCESRQASIKTLTKILNLTERQVMDALVPLVGTGVIQREDEFSYRIGSRLFEKWVKEQ